MAVTGRDPARLASLAAEGMLALRADMGQVSESRSAMTRVAATMGEIDVLFVNAGIGGFAAVPDVTEEFWDRVHAVNLRRAFFAVQAALPHLRDGGAIVLTRLHRLPDLALPGNVAYAAAKAGLRQVARTLGVELLPRRIRVNMVSPGPTETEIFKRGASEQDIRTPAQHDEERGADEAHGRTRRSGAGGSVPRIAGSEFHHRRGSVRRRRLLKP